MRRRLVTIAARDYPTGDDGDDSFARGIDAQIKVLHDWLLDGEALGKDAFVRDLHRALFPRTRREVDDFLVKEALRHLLSTDVLVLYVTGHGVRGKSNSHYLLLPETDEAHILATAVPTGRLVAELLDSDADHVLVLVDSCYAGTLHAEVANLLNDLPQERRESATLVVVAACDFAERPRVGEFTGLLEATIKRLREAAGYTAPLLTVEEFLKELRYTAKTARKTLPLVVWPPATQGDRPSPCLPNPVPRRTPVVAEALRQVALTETDLAYWLERASGRTDSGDSGWYSAGRSTLMRGIIEFLNDRTRRAIIVTGTSGTGKSALLARVVTFSDDDFRRDERFRELIEKTPTEMRPEHGAVHVAVSARNRGVEEITADIGHKLSVPSAGGASPLLDRLHEMTANGLPVTIVVDGVDEAISPLRVISDLLAPLARLTTSADEPGVRMLIGVRSPNPRADGADETGDRYLLHALRRATEPSVTLRVDGPDAQEDIAEYVRALLLGIDTSPYADHQEDAAAAAKVVAAAVAPSFLDARVAARRLREATMRQDLGDARWRDRLHEGTLGLLHDDVADVAAKTGYSREDLVTVLRATAFGLGAGLPWAEVWSAVAEAVRGERWPEADKVIAAVLGSRLSGYLVTDVADARVVYRPLHERVAEVLRDDPASLADES
jgi:hypothetical protein